MAYLPWRYRGMSSGLAQVQGTERPSPCVGRDELHTDEMWNSNSLISWLLVRAGVDTDRSSRHPGRRWLGHRPVAVTGRVACQRAVSAGGVGIIAFEGAELAWIGFQPLEAVFGVVRLIVVVLARRGCRGDDPEGRVAWMRPYGSRPPSAQRVTESSMYLGAVPLVPGPHGLSGRVNTRLFLALRDQSQGRCPYRAGVNRTANGFKLRKRPGGRLAPGTRDVLPQDMDAPAGRLITESGRRPNRNPARGGLMSNTIPSGDGTLTGSPSDHRFWGPTADQAATAKRCGGVLGTPRRHGVWTAPRVVAFR
jgi:hypothetical protein